MTPVAARVRQARAGITLIEILVAALITLVLLGALTYAFVAGIDLRRLQNERRQERDRTEALEGRIADLLRGAKMVELDTDTTTYFVGESTGDSSGDLGADRLTFTTVAPAVPMAARVSEDDFETQHLARGPVGGVAEVSLGLTPVGQPLDDRGGLFERVQRPSDGDPTQGGTESLLGEGVREIGFQFWDGTQWAVAWDTQAGERRLPAAVRVSYVLDGDGEGAAPRSFVVPIPASDVDAQNPAGVETTSGGPASQ